MKLINKLFAVCFLFVFLVLTVQAGELNPGFRAVKGHSGNFKKKELKTNNNTNVHKKTSTKSQTQIQPVSVKEDEFNLTNTIMPSDEEIWAVINKYNFDENQKNFLFKETKKRLLEIYSK